MPPIAFQPLAGIYEPSAIQQLPDARFLVVEDEKEHPFSLISFTADGRLAGPPISVDTPDRLNDLEGLTSGPNGFLYAITSHSRDSDGERKKSRCRLLRFRLTGELITDAVLTEGLLPALTAAHPALAAAADVSDVKGEAGLNIEALEMSPDGRQLLIGLRGPLIDGQAVLAVLASPDALFDSGTPMSVSVRLLDLGGQGIRGIAWVPALGGYLVIAGPLFRAPAPFRLWFWNGTDSAAQAVSVPGLSDLVRAEGVAAALIGGIHSVLLVSDDGNRKEGRNAGHLLLAINQFRIGSSA